MNINYSNRKRKNNDDLGETRRRMVGVKKKASEAEILANHGGDCEEKERRGIWREEGITSSLYKEKGWHVYVNKHKVYLFYFLIIVVRWGFVWIAIALHVLNSG